MEPKAAPVNHKDVAPENKDVPEDHKATEAGLKTVSEQESVDSKDQNDIAPEHPKKKKGRGLWWLREVAVIEVNGQRNRNSKFQPTLIGCVLRIALSALTLEESSSSWLSLSAFSS
mgnify:CR=1 FL=1